MKKNGMKFIFLFYFSLITVITFSQTYSPITVTGFNMDVVAEGTGNTAIPVTSTAMDLSNNIVCTKQFATANSFTPANTYGLPNNGTIVTGLRTYQIAPYTGNEVLNVFTASTQTLTLQTPANYTNISLAVLATENAAKMNVVFNFSDGTNQPFSNQAVPDWFFNSTPALPLIFNGYGRLGRTSTPFSYNSAPAGNPNLYGFDFALPCTKTLISISIKNVTTATASTVNRIFVFAVSGAVTSIVTPIVSNDTVCPGTPVTFNIQNPDPNQNYIWYDAPYNGNFLGVGNTYSPPNPNASIIYYVQTINNTTGCPGSTLTPDSIIVSSPPPPSVKSPIIDCKGQPFVMSVINPQSLTYNWYSDSTKTNLIGTGVSISMPNIVSDTIYYVQSTGSSSCSSKLTPVLVKTSKPIGPISGSQNICLGRSISLTDTTVGGIWSSLNNFATINNSGIVTGVKPGIDTIKYVINFNVGCPDSAFFIVSINPLPQIGQITQDSTVCLSKSVSLFDTTFGGTWVSSNSAIATISNTGVVTGIAVGVDTIRYIVTNANGCTDSVFLSFSVKKQPVAAPITGLNTVCVGKNITLSDTSAGGVWYSDHVGIATILNGVVTGNASGIDTIRYKIVIPGGCGDSALFAVTVNALPIIAPITGKNAICIGKSNTLINTTSGGVWNSTNTAVATIDLNGLVNAITPGIDTIRYTVTNANGCTDSVSFLITIYATPIVAPISGNNKLCVGSSTVLSESTSGGVWVNQYPVVATLNAGILKGISLGVDTVKYIVTDLHGCTDSVFIPIVVNALPIIAPITGSNVVCFGKSTTLFCSTPGGTWVNTNPAIATDNGGGNLTGNIAGKDTIRYIVFNGCTDSVYTVLTVNPLPVIPSIAGNDSVCVSKTIVLTNTTAGGSWISTNTAIASVNNTGAVSGITGGQSTIRYVVTNANGCTDSVTKNIVVVSPSIASITGINAICIGTTTTLTDVTPGGLWSSANPLIAAITSSGSISGIKAGTTNILYTVNNAIGCTNQVLFPFTVNALPVITPISGGNSVCLGKSLLLSDAAAAIGVWTSSNPVVAPINNGSVDGNSVGVSTITYTGTDVNGCIDSTKLSFTVKANPIASFTLPKNICLPDGIGQFINTSTIPLGAQLVSYLWNFSDTSNPVTSSAVNPSHQFKAPIQQPSYTITLRVNVDGCLADTSFVMLSSIIHQPPVASFFINPLSGEVCLNNPVVFTDNSPQPIVKSIWYFGDGTIDTTPSISYVYPNATTYWASHAVIDINNCISINKNQIKITVVPYPEVNAGNNQYVLPGNSVEMNPTVIGDSLSYNWTPATFLNSATTLNPVCTPVNDITYTLTVTGKNGCSNSSNIKVIVLGNAIIPNVFSPNGDGIHDTWKITSIEKYPSVTVKVFNRYGQIVYNSFGYATPWDGTYNGNPLPIGTYFYVIEPGNSAPRLTGWVEIIR